MVWWSGSLVVWQSATKSTDCQSNESEESLRLEYGVLSFSWIDRCFRLESNEILTVPASLIPITCPNRRNCNNHLTIPLLSYQRKLLGPHSTWYSLSYTNVIRNPYISHCQELITLEPSSIADFDTIVATGRLITTDTTIGRYFIRWSINWPTIHRDSRTIQLSMPSQGTSSQHQASCHTSASASASPSNHRYPWGLPR